jgi:hypothetical protein
MKRTVSLFIILFSVSVFAQKDALRLHPDNPHYFLFRGKPTILITSGEHYGSVVNLDFDYIKYLDELKANGLNYTRIFSGSYIEIPGAFGITKNTLAPKFGSFICPWKRSAEPGYEDGGNKFDLDKWDEEYFKRLKNFVQEAGSRGIVVEMTLFSSLYRDEGWKSSPLNGINNVNKIDSIARKNIQTLDNGRLLKYQENMVRKIVAELTGFDNVFFEIQNEPWADFGIKVLDLDRKEEDLASWQRIVEVANPASIAWQKHMVSVIVKEMAKRKNTHLIAQNFANFQYKLEDVNPDVSIVNFHYALPLSVSENYGLNKVIGFDESGFSGGKDETYRKQAWRFIMSGGGLFNSLDYSFTTDSPEGTDVQQAPGGGSRELRKQLKILKDFMESFDFVKLKPVKSQKGDDDKHTVYQLAEPGKQYAFYFEDADKNKVSLNLPSGNYTIDIISVKDGTKRSLGRKNHTGGELQLDIPGRRDFALSAVIKSKGNE